MSHLGEYNGFLRVSVRYIYVSYNDFGLEAPTSAVLAVLRHLLVILVPAAFVLCFIKPDTKLRTFTLLPQYKPSPVAFLYLREHFTEKDRVYDVCNNS